MTERLKDDDLRETLEGTLDALRLMMLGVCGLEDADLQSGFGFGVKFIEGGVQTVYDELELRGRDVRGPVPRLDPQ